MSSTPAADVLVVTTPQLREVLLDVLHQATASARREAEEEASELAVDRRIGYVSNGDAVKLLGISAATLSRWRADGLPYAKISGTVLYRAEDLQAYIEARRVQ